MVPKKLFVTIGAIAAACVAVIAAFSSEKTINYANAVSTQKEFFFDKNVGDQVEYGGNSTSVVSNVVTGISSTIATKLYRESGERGERTGHDGCFFSAEYCNQKTFAFEAGLNNLIGFEIRFKYSYDKQWDDGLGPFSYNVTLTFYHGKAVVDTANYSLDATTRGTTYTHTWSKGPEVSEKIDYVKCSLNNGGGGNKDSWRVLTIDYYKVTWDC